MRAILQTLLWTCALCVFSFAGSGSARANCALIPTAVRELRSTDGLVDRPFAPPGDRVTVFAESACDPSSQRIFFDRNAANNQVTLVFEPPNGGPLTTLSPFPAASVGDCGFPFLNQRCFAIEFVVPDTTNVGPMVGTGLPLTGPARIEVRNVAEAGQPLVATIGPLFERTRSCNDKNRYISIFEHFSVLPPRNTFSSGGQDLYGTVDGSGSLLVPFDYSTVLASTQGAAAKLRVLEVTANLPNGLAAGNGLPGASGTSIRIPRPSVLSRYDFARAFSLRGRPIPPLLEVVSTTNETAGGVRFGDRIVGSIDFVDSVLRIAREGPNPSNPSQSIQLFALAGEQVPSPGGLTLRNGAGPIQLADVNLSAGGAAPLASLRSSAAAAAIGREEALESPAPADRNADLDTLDRVVEVINLDTGASTNTGFAAVEVADTVTRAAIAADGGLVAFLQSEAADGASDVNLDGDAVDAILRIFTADGSPVSTGAALAADAAARINGVSPVAISSDFVFFQREETEAATNGTAGTSTGAIFPVVNMKRPAVSGPTAGGHSNILAFGTDLFDEGLVDDNVYVITPDLSLVAPVSDPRGFGQACGTGVANGDSGSPTISSNGATIAFDSLATNLGAANGVRHVYVGFMNYATAPTPGSCIGAFPQRPVSGIVASRGPANVLGNGTSAKPALSADGHFLVFESSATNLVAGDTNGHTDLFLAELSGSASLGTTRVSVPAAGGEADGDSTGAALSADGRFLAFTSAATNLVPGDTNGVPDVFVLDRSDGSITRASVDSDGVQGSAASGDAAISADGRVVAFTSAASNLVPDDTNAVVDVFVRDLSAGHIERLSVSSAGAEQNLGALGRPALHGDGRLVVFASPASNLVPGDSNNFSDVFRFDRLTRTLELMSVREAGGSANGASREPAVSPDGRFVAFASDADDMILAENQFEGLADLFWRSTTSGTSFNPPDTDLDDSVLFALNVLGPSLVTSGTAVAEVAVAGPRALMIADDARTLMFEAGGPVVRDMGISGRQVALSTGAACVISTSDQLWVADAEQVGQFGAPATLVTGFTAASVKAVDGRCVALTMGGGLRVVNATTASVVDTGQLATDFQLASRGIAFRTCESQVAADLNGDFDVADCVMRFWDFGLAEDGNPATDPLQETGRSAIVCTLPACMPFFEPYRLRGSMLSFVAREPDEVELGGSRRNPICLPTGPPGNCDLTGDGDGNDLTIQVMSLDVCSPETCKAQVFPIDEERPPEVVPFPEVVAGDQLVITIQLPASLLGPEYADFPPDQLLTVIAGDADDDGTLDSDGVRDAASSVGDNCPDLANVSQADADGDALGAECDLALNQTTNQIEPNDDPQSPVPGAEAEIPGDHLCDLDKSGRISEAEVGQVAADRGIHISSPADTDGDGSLDPTDDRDPDADGKITMLDIRRCEVLRQEQPANGCGLGLELLAPLALLACRRVRIPRREPSQ